MLLERLGQPDAAAGILLDGFPRNTAQAEVLDKVLADKGGRWTWPRTSRFRRPIWWLASAGAGSAAPAAIPYHDQTKPPKTPGVCDIDGSELYQRTDDRPATVQARLRQQLGALDAVVNYYRSRGVLRTVDGRRSIEPVADDLLAAIAPATGRRN